MTDSAGRVVVIGGGFGGLAVARRLGRAGVPVVVVDRRNHHLFQPLLYQVASGSLSPGDISAPIRGVLSGYDSVSVMLGEVTAVDVAAKTVHMGERRLSYDQLVVAAGARHSYFGHDEWEHHAPGLKTLDDALEIRQQILLAFERAEWTDDADERRKLLSFVVVGGGPTGVELAGSLAEIARKTLAGNFRRIAPEGARITLVEASPVVLGSFPESLQRRALAQLRDTGVEVRLGRPVITLDEDGVVLAPAAEGGEEERIHARTVLWGAGVAGAPVGRTLGVPLDRAGRVIVGPELNVPGSDEVYVIGDLASASHQTGKPLPGVAQVALQMGHRAAENILARRKGRAPKAFVYRDLGSMATIGRRRAVAQLGRVHLSGLPAWLIWLFVHLMALVSFSNRLVVFVKWAWNYVTWEHSNRLIRGERPGQVPSLVDRGGPEVPPGLH